MSLIAVTKEVRPGVAVVTLNRPESANALSTALIDELNGALTELDGAEAVRAVVLTGAGGRAFCAGMDLKERAGLSQSQIALQRRKLIGLLAYLYRYPKGTVAAVQGAAMGGGFELALACDLLVAGQSSRFGLPEVKLGIMPAGGGTQTLTWAVGRARANSLILTGRILTGPEAADWGLAAQVVDDESVLETALATAEAIAAAAPIGIRQAKRAMRAAHKSFAGGLDEEDEAYRECLYSEDRLEGLRAFAEKRPARYQGR